MSKRIAQTGRIATVHLVCSYIKGCPDKCKRCPEFEDSEHGRVQRACRALAEEVVMVVKKRGPFTNRSSNANWRKRIAKYGE